MAFEIGQTEEVAPGVFRIERVEPSGWGLNVLLLRLPGGGLFVHSPTWLGPETFARVEEVGRPEVLFAPNHYHHLSLGRFRERYPHALAVASRGALPRLEKKGHRGVAAIEQGRTPMPDGASVVVPEGTASGEAWLSLAGTGGVTWVVCDAFFDVTRPVRGVLGAGLRALKTVPGLCIGQTFPWLALRDRGAYVRWAEAAIARERPTRVVMSHGEAVTGEDLPERLTTLVRARLG